MTGKSGIKLGSGGGVKSVTVNFGIRGLKKWGGACDTSEALFFDITGFSGQICLAATTVQKQGFREFGVSVLGRSADLGMGRWRRGFRGFPTFLGFGD